MTAPLAGQVAIVTGGARGMGRGRIINVASIVDFGFTFH